MPTTDFTEDACDILDQGESDYIIITLEGPATRFVSSLSPENRETLRRMLVNGDFAEMMLDILDSKGKC